MRLPVVLIRAKVAEDADFPIVKTEELEEPIVPAVRVNAADTSILLCRSTPAALFNIICLAL